MTIQAAISLATPIALLATSHDESAAQIAPDVSLGRAGSPEALDALARRCSMLTFDHEQVDPGIMRDLEAAGHTLRPSARTMAIAQDKSLQRALFQREGLPVPPWQQLQRAADLAEFARSHGWPVVLKAARGGYDGRGVWVADSQPTAAALAADLLAAGVPLIVEAWVPMERELAVLVARSPSGGLAVYPVVETVQAGGICREAVAPASIDSELAQQAIEIATTIATTIDAAGIIAVELFLAGGKLLINEIATRPHNSGHLSIEGCCTSQFENHLRAILDWPLGSTELLAPAAAMVNLIATETAIELPSRLPRALAVKGAHIHLYGKEMRPGRKVGHVTALGAGIEAALTTARTAAALLMEELEGTISEDQRPLNDGW